MSTRAAQFEILAAGVIYGGALINNPYVKFYEAGTETPKVAWNDKEKESPITKAQLDVNGRAVIYGDGIYKLRFYTGDPDAEPPNTGVLLFTIDNYKVQSTTFSVVSKTSAYTATPDDDVVLCNGTFTLSLYSVANYDHQVTIKNIGTGVITIDPYGAETIDGETTYSLYGQNTVAQLYPDRNANTWRLGYQLNDVASISFTQKGTGAITRTAREKMREIVSVNDFDGADNTGETASDSAFEYAINAVGPGGTIFVPPGNYKIDSNIDGTGVNWIFENVSFTGAGKLSTRSYTMRDSKGLFLGNPNGYITSTGLSKTFSRIAEINAGDYPRKYFPTAAFIEPLRLSPMVTVFENSDGSVTEVMHEQYYREVISEMSENGISSIILAYVEYFGFWFYEPGFDYHYDYDTSRYGNYWGNWLALKENVVPFDVVRVTLEEAAKYGMSVYIGLGRNGDTELLGDLYNVNILSYPDPERYGLSLSTRTTNAINRTRQVAADIFSRYGNIASFAGWFISHEPSDFTSANLYIAPTTWDDGENPSLRSYNKPIIIAPAKVTGLSSPSSLSTKLIESGCDIIMPQDAVGPGLDFDNSIYTYIPSVAIGGLDSYYSAWNKAISIANAKSALTNRRLKLWSTTEMWEMGTRPDTGLSLSAVSGSSITATAGSAVFSSGDVDRWITSDDGGCAQITGYTSSTIVTISTMVTGGRAFGTTSFDSGKWSLNDGYTNAFPTDINRFKNQLYEEWPYVEAVCLYAWFGVIDSGTLSLRLSQSNSGRTDYRTLAKNLYDGYNSWVRGQIKKYHDAPNVRIVQMRLFSYGSLSPSKSITEDFDTFYPEHDGSTVYYIMFLRGFSAEGTTNLSIRLRVNEVNVVNVTDASASGYAAGSYNVIYKENAKGLPRKIGFNVESTVTNFTLQGCSILCIEVV